MITTCSNAQNRWRGTRYSYVYNSPLNWTDPTGLAPNGMSTGEYYALEAMYYGAGWGIGTELGNNYGGAVGADIGGTIGFAICIICEAAPGPGTGAQVLTTMAGVAGGKILGNKLGGKAGGYVGGHIGLAVFKAIYGSAPDPTASKADPNLTQKQILQLCSQTKCVVGSSGYGDQVYGCDGAHSTGHCWICKNSNCYPAPPGGPPWLNGDLLNDSITFNESPVDVTLNSQETINLSQQSVGSSSFSGLQLDSGFGSSDSQSFNFGQPSINSFNLNKLQLDIDLKKL